jgi:Flp pilus assembly protein TadB
MTYQITSGVPAVQQPGDRSSVFHPVSENLRRTKMKLNKNMGTTDRIVRLVVAVVFAWLYFSGLVPGVYGTVLLVLGIVFALTSAVSFCPLYLPFGFSTLKK